jgi:hypothetical protein
VSARRGGDGPRPPFAVRHASSGSGRTSCSAGVRDGDDLLGVDALQEDAGRAEVGMAELALDDVEWHAFTGELNGVGVAQLMRREPTPHARLCGEPAELSPDPGARPGPASGRSVDDAEQRADGSSTRAPSQSCTRGSPRGSVTARAWGPAPRRARWTNSESAAASLTRTRWPTRQASCRWAATSLQSAEGRTQRMFNQNCR